MHLCSPRGFYFTRVTLLPLSVHVKRASLFLFSLPLTLVWRKFIFYRSFTIHYSHHLYLYQVEVSEENNLKRYFCLLFTIIHLSFPFFLPFTRAPLTSPPLPLMWAFLFYSFFSSLHFSFSLAFYFFSHYLNAAVQVQFTCNDFFLSLSPCPVCRVFFHRNQKVVFYSTYISCNT